jgi:NitT/TauT family transport system permease protein
LALAASGFCLAITVFHWRRATKALSAVLEIWQIVPPLIVIPIALSIAGTSQLAQFIAGSTYAFVASIALTTGALQRTPDSYVALARLAGARRWWITRNVFSPVVLIESFGSLKLIGAFTLGIIIVLEYLAAPSGIGRVMKFAMSYHSIELLMVGVLWAILIGMSFDFAIDCLSRRFLRWTFRES